MLARSCERTNITTECAAAGTLYLLSYFTMKRFNL